jgi:hypothetical protein
MVYVQRSLRFLLCVLAALALNPAARADILYSQAPLNAGTAIFANYSLVGVFGFQNADSFTLSAPSIITGFRWWGTAVGDTTVFVARHFNDVVTAPNTFDPLLGTITPTATALTDSVGNAIVQYDLQLVTALPLAGTHFFSVFFDSDAEWAWLESAEGDGTSAVRSFEGDSWSIPLPDDLDAVDLAFAVIGELQPQQVAEPSTLALFVIAAMATLFNRRRRPACAS